MLSLNRILCPVDFSESSRRALQYAAAMGKWYGARVIVLHVFSNPVIDRVSLYRGQPLALHNADPDALGARLAEFVAAAAGDTPVTCELVAGKDVRHETLRVARAIAADVIVMATHGRSGGVEGLLLGSVAERVVKGAQCPVMLIPPAAVRNGSPIDVPFSRILCAVDFANASTPAVALALELAEEADAHLTLMHAMEVPAELQARPENGRVDVPAVRAAADAAARQRLRDLVPADARTYCKIHTDLRQGLPYRAILDGAQESDAALIVMGIHGRNAFDRLLFGSSTHAVLRHARCPVLTVPAGQAAVAVESRRDVVSIPQAKAS